MALVLLEGGPGDLAAASGARSARPERPGPVAPGAARIRLDSARPSSCPSTAAAGTDPNTGDNEPQSSTGTFPWPAPPANANPEDYAANDRTPARYPPVRPANWSNGGGDWKLTSARTTNPVVDQNPQELCGVEGNSVDTAWQDTTGRPDTVIAVTDSGVEWCDPSIVDKIYLSRSALPLPENAQGLTKPQLEAEGVHFTDGDPYDLNDSGVFDVAQYGADPRVLGSGALGVKGAEAQYFCSSGANRAGYAYSGISPADLIATFGTKGSPSYYGRAGPAGFTEAIAGWNFVDDNNNPYDDVHYDHGTGEAEDATGAADALHNEVGACPDCMVLPIRVGQSFIAEGNAFAQGVLFAVDSGASVVQEALGTLDVTTTDSQAVAYAHAHGVPVVASAADEEAEHHNEPSNLPGTIPVNSVTNSSQTVAGQSVPLDNPPSYLYLNGCTNYGANIAVSVESASCSSEATGKTGGITGLIESEAKNLAAQGKLAPYPGLQSAAGERAVLSSTEVRELIEMSADDVDFKSAAPPFGPPDNYAVVSPVPTTRYPTQPGYDMYTGYGRIDAGRILGWLAHDEIPPEASFGTMPWFDTYDPTTATLDARAAVGAVRDPGTPVHWQLQYGIGTQPEPTAWHTLASGTATSSARAPTTEVSADLGPAQLGRIASQLPASDRGTGPAGRPAPDADAFTLRVVAVGPHGLVGMDRRTEYLAHDSTLMSSAPARPGGSIDASPTLAPIGPGGEDALIVATADGVIHAYVPVADPAHPGHVQFEDLPGWPVTTDPLPSHLGEQAYTSGLVTSAPRASIVGGVAVGDLLGNGKPDVVAADMSGHVYAWDPGGHLLRGFPVSTDPNYSAPSARDANNRLLPGILAAPSLAHLQGSSQLDIVASSLDRHVYAWQPNGQPVPGWPVLVVDPSKVAAVDPTTNHVTFDPTSHVEIGTQILDTPAVGALGGGGPPDLVVGTDEEYGEPPNISAVDALNYALGQVPVLNPANSRVYALGPSGSRTTPDCSKSATGTQTAQPDACAVLKGWPVAIADYDAGLLPDVGDGTTASPALADLAGNGRLEVGAMTTVGPAYVLGPDGSSYLGNGPDHKPLTLSTGPAGPLSNSPETPSIPALGMPVFAALGPGAPGTSLVAPAASLGKAIDTALPAQQQPNDNQIDAWNLTTGQLQTAFPQVVNDLQFFVQPLVADVGGDGSGPYVVDGTATSDIRALDALGREAPGFPKFTGGWMVNSPAFGALGHLPQQVLAAGTRDGDLFVWSTPTSRCAPSGPWPRSHHDLANTNDLAARAPAAARCAGG